MHCEPNRIKMKKTQDADQRARIGKAEKETMEEQKDKITIRRAVSEDAAKLLEIYRPYVEETAISFEWEVPSLAEFTDRMKAISAKYPYLVAEADGEPVGYDYAGTFKERAAYDWDVEVTIYTRKDWSKQGLGRMLYEALESALRTQNILNVNACIAYPADGADDAYLTKNSMQFHEHMGYRLVGRFTKCGYKFGRWYDMVWMEKHIGEHVSEQPPVIPFAECLFLIDKKVDTCR